MSRYKRVISKVVIVVMICLMTKSVSFASVQVSDEDDIKASGSNATVSGGDGSIDNDDISYDIDDIIITDEYEMSNGSDFSSLLSDINEVLIRDIKITDKKEVTETDSTEVKTDSTEVKTDSTEAKTDSTEVKTDSTEAKTDSTEAKTDSTEAIKVGDSSGIFMSVAETPSNASEKITESLTLVIHQKLSLDSNSDLVDSVSFTPVSSNESGSNRNNNSGSTVKATPHTKTSSRSLDVDVDRTRGIKNIEELSEQDDIPEETIQHIEYLKLPKTGDKTPILLFKFLLSGLMLFVIGLSRRRL